ncbi:MAG: hypothetical protein ACOX6T_19580 [Myxococcales bacterium]|jgi:hypothetical protein
MSLRSWITAAAFATLLAACADPEEQFKAGRLYDACDRAWPVCTTTGGCVLGNAQYLEGRFPGTRRFVVRTEGQAEIAIVMLLKTQGATGAETRFEWNEAGCGSKSVEAVEGLSLFKEYEALGEVRRVAKVHREGDHLIEVTSDATADYLLKVEVK